MTACVINPPYVLYSFKVLDGSENISSYGISNKKIQEFTDEELMFQANELRDLYRKDVILTAIQIDDMWEPVAKRTANTETNTTTREDIIRG